MARLFRWIDLFRISNYDGIAEPHDSEEEVGNFQDGSLVEIFGLGDEKYSF